MTTTPDLGIPELVQSQANPDITHNEALVLIQALLNGVIDKDLTAPPGSPTEGDAYLINTASPTGAWAGHAYAVAIYWGSAWRFVPGNDDAGSPITMGSRQEGLRVWVRDENRYYVWRNTVGSPLTFAWAVNSDADVFPSVAPGTLFVFEGDSKTADLGTLDPYSEFFANDPASDGIGGVVNVGASGNDLADIESQYAAQVYPYRPGGASNPNGDPAVLSVWIGTNDFYRLVAQGYTDAADYCTDLAAYWQQAVDDGFRVIAWTIDARGDEQSAPVETDRKAINAFIRSSQIPTWIVDPETVTKDYTNTEWWNVDEIHYVENGNYRLAKILTSTLAAGSTALAAPLTHTILEYLQTMTGFVGGLLDNTDGDDFSDEIGAARLNATNVFTGGIQTINNNSGSLPAPSSGFGTVLHTGGADGAVHTWEMDVFGSLAVWRARRANGTNASKTAVTTNDNIFNLSPQGYQTTTGAYATAAGFQTMVTEPWTNTANGSKVRINAAENGATVTGKWDFQGGAWATVATGGNQGNGTFNAVAVYDDGVLLCAPLHMDNPEIHNQAFWDNIVPNRRDVQPAEYGLLDEVLSDPDPLTGKQSIIRPARKVVVRDAIDETTVTKHRTAKRHFDMIAEGFNPNDPASWVERLRTDRAVPGMPTLAEHEKRYPVDPKTGERQAVDKYSIHERTERSALALDYMALVIASLYAEVKELRKRLDAAESRA